jgi:hypothetical protein
MPKLTSPRVAGILARERLFEQLAADHFPQPAGYRPVGGRRAPLLATSCNVTDAAAVETVAGFASAAEQSLDPLPRTVALVRR